MLRLIICTLLAVAMCCSTCCEACNLTQTLRDEKSGLLHRCLNITGTNEWHLNIACWIRRPLGDDILELEVGQKYNHPNGRIMAECRHRRYRTALVYHVCFDDTGNGSTVRWPDDVWTGDNGLQYTCTNASLATSSSYFDQSSRIVLFGCNSTATGLMVAPGLTELQDQSSIEKRCVFSGTDRRDPQYLMEAIGCWLRKSSHTDDIVRLAFGEAYFLPAKRSLNQTILATCKERYYKYALVYHQCKENGTSGEILRTPGSVWIDIDGVQRECLPADPSELVSAQIIVRACYENSTLFYPGTETRMSDGSIKRCVFNKYKSSYGWFEIVGCWLKEPFWSKVTNVSPDLRIGKEFCPDGQICLARCEKRRYREQIAIVPKVCFENVGKGAIFRLPHENWTDDSGVDRTCVPMADQSSQFGVGAESIRSGCDSKWGNGTVPPGAVFYSGDFLVYECTFNSYNRQYSFRQIIGCWMHDSSGRRVRIDNGEAFQLPSGQTVATCRKKRYSRTVTFTVEVCFKDSESSPLNWDNSSIAFPGHIMKNGSSRLQCDPAATYSDGVNAKWILYGCDSASGIEAPGSKQLFNDATVKECAYNDKDGRYTAYSWVKPLGCWFRDHLNQTIVISKFDVVYNHSDLGIPTARCEYNRYSNPNLIMFVCISPANRRLYTVGDEWTDSATGVVKQCVSASRYNLREGVVTIDAGCWLKDPKATDRNSSVPLQQLIASNGSIAYGSENRVLRCDFNEYKRKYEWQASVACWYTANDDSSTSTVLQIGQEVWYNGMFIYKCHDTRKGAAFIRHSCEHNGTWHAAMSTWRDSSYQYRCQPASADSHAKTEKTYCITDDGTAIDESEIIKGVQYVCMRICGFLVFMRDPTPRQYQLLFNFINNCHAVNMNIINNIG